MEIDKNIILKLINVLEDLKKSLTDKDYKIETQNLENKVNIVAEDEVYIGIIHLHDVLKEGIL